MEQTTTYRGFTISVKQDQQAQNPFEHWDCLEPLLVKGNNHQNDWGSQDIVDFIQSHKVSEENYKKILEALYVDVSDLDKNLSAITETQELLEEIELFDFEQMESLCKIFTIPFYRGTETGYSQSDWVDTFTACLLYTSPSPRDLSTSRMPSSA